MKNCLIGSLICLLLSCFISNAAAAVNVIKKQNTAVCKNTAVCIKNIEADGYAVFYNCSNPIGIVSFSLDDFEIYDPLERFSGYDKDDLRVVFEKGKAQYSFKEVDFSGLLDLRKVQTVAPSKGEIIAFINKLKKSLNDKDFPTFKKLYFSGLDCGTNPDSILGTDKRMSNMIEVAFKSAQKITIDEQIYYWSGKNYAMIAGRSGRINILIDGKKSFFVPIFIGKDKKTMQVKSL